MKMGFVVAIAISLAVLAGCAYRSAAKARNRPEALAAGPVNSAVEKEELLVFAAASLTEAMNEIAELYSDKEPDGALIYNFDSSGTLKTQIQEGADCDIFISAGQKQMNQLDFADNTGQNTEGLDFVLEGSRFDIVKNTVVLIVPKDSDKGIASFEDALDSEVELFAMGNSDVPVGQYTREIYENLGLWEQLANSGKVSYGSNVKEVLAQVEAAAVDCGAVYSTDAAAAEGVKVVAAAPEGTHGPITYPAAIMKYSGHIQEAREFMEFLKGDECRAVFEKFGFSRP